MILNTNTGDITFDNNIVLKAEMELEEIKKSKVMTLLRDDSAQEIDNSYDMKFKPIEVFGSNVNIRALMLNGRVDNIYITLDELQQCYEDPTIMTIQKVEEITTLLLEKVLQCEFVERYGSMRFDWGDVELRTSYRENSCEILINYLSNIKEL